jgi:hypothetical protein
LFGNAPEPMLVRQSAFKSFTLSRFNSVSGE